MTAPPKPGDVLLVAFSVVNNRQIFTVFERATVFDGDRSTQNTHVWVKLAQGTTTGVALADEGTTWVREDDPMALGALIAARALIGKPPVKPEPLP